MNRRDFIQQSALAGAGMMLPFTGKAAAAFPEVRIAANKRNFTSKAVEATIQRVQKMIGDEELAWLFGNCFPNTLDTTVHYSEKGGKPDTFVITGDIDAMWLRDSTAQVWPYLSLVKDDEPLRKLIEGVVRRQTKCILIDPYANAFYNGPGHSEWYSDNTKMKPELHERKWEIDSLCYPVRLAYGYWKTTGDTSPFDADWKQSIRMIIQTFREQQRKENRGPYTFTRKTAWATDTVPGNGYGNPTKPVGLITSIFRPSDDATIYPFLVPSNFFAVAILKQAAEISQKIGDSALATECKTLATEVEQALKKYAIVEHPKFGKVFPFEVDGFGNALFMDDANVPSLLALPYLDSVSVKDPIYQNTRKLILSDSNPYFSKGKAGEGIGSPHTLVDSIWPIAVTMRALTSQSDAEIRAQLKQQKMTHAGTGFMHESFNKDDANNFTRKWFAWSNTLFGELVLKVANERPAILKGAL
ncbi:MULTISPECIES: glycoside hydrolase family 125 protein [Siphonobacter]|uniref:Metal-independent alpha-mannosidase n=1 Tax=Siphonobacter curvatus TaxID=2094562 RepID=A0A2S7IKE3_9BACT|nr:MULTISPECIES: glycoside hydrolase family 125 protein [Siphonobacter]PMD95878.1 metal-independent alpha-mannosidase [Siphonobacter sp. BAB-5405]PQA58145.1 metal-independent alpha-mannosidase [Siphonobacter curvatus]